MGTRGPKSELVLFLSVDFYDDPKVAALTLGEREQWLRILMEQLRSGNGAEFRGHAYGVGRKRIDRYIEAGLLDEEDGLLLVHGWDEWNGREAYKRFLARERKRRQRRGAGE